MGANGGSDGLVLGFEHSSTCSGRHHRQGRNSRRDQSLREMMPIVRGRVKSLKDKGFGFLECCDRAGDMFFHQTESNENLCVGDEVEFRYLIFFFYLALIYVHYGGGSSWFASLSHWSVTVTWLLFSSSLARLGSHV